MDKAKQNDNIIHTPKGEVRVQSFCSPAEIRKYTFDKEFGSHAQYKSLYTRRESLEQDAASADTNVVLAISDQNHIIGFAVFAYPDPDERWAELGAGIMMEIKVIEVCRSWRKAHLARNLLQMAISHPAIEEKIAYMVGYSWTWDLDETDLKAQEYREVLIKLFEISGFSEYETNEANICMKHENLFMCRIGSLVSDETRDRFNWLRFGITPEGDKATASAEKVQRDSNLVRTLFLPLQEEQLTTLGIYYDQTTQQVLFQTAREWDDEYDWSCYQGGINAGIPLTGRTKCLGHEESVSLFRRYVQEDYLEEVVDHLKKGCNQGMVCYYNKKLGISVINFIHSSTLGKDSIYHAIRSGGICFSDPEANEMDAIATGLNLSRAMSFKNASAQLPFGGCRLSVLSEPIRTTDRERLGFLAYTIDKSHCFVGPDMGFPPELIDVIKREGYSHHVTGGLDSKVGPPGSPTAYGLYLAIKEAAYVKFGSLNLTGKKIVVQGLGSVGFPLVDEYLIKENSELYVSDISQVPIGKLAGKHAGQFQTLATDSIPTFKGDIWLPCAVGGVLDSETIKKLHYSIVLGAANNTLKAESQEEEIRLAQQLGKRNILFQIDWMHNTAGIIGGAEEYINHKAASRQQVLKKVEKVCRDGSRLNLRNAAKNKITPTEEGYRHFNSLIYQSNRVS